ncbi:spore germination protein [Bacillus taeanensis]|uniref:Spore gernimation protein GerB n=1 Tax=Bacillus taeanensis TaxID=273032 RepID=A0A366Y0G6_9BACI|nr:spore germination protein [Bacillus taeanensis]RBW71338.1 spore gernimation protein GerB [Bacillus taeanensis]
MPTAVKEELLISPFLAFFIVHSIQLGVGILGFQRHIAEIAGYDGWISVLLAGITIHLVVWIMYQLLNDHQNDLMLIHENIFGKWIGKLFSFVFMIYFIFIALTVLRTYLEVIQVWLFPQLNMWTFSLIFLILAYYIVSSGFRVVAGICFLGVILPMGLLVTLLFPLQHGHFANLFPVLDHPFSAILGATKEMVLSYLGFEVLLIVYPFLKNPEKSRKWTHYGAAFTTFIYLVVTLVTYTFYSEGQLAQTIWPTLTLWKIVSFPFLERFEYIGISIWAIVVLPNICLALWGASRIGKVIFSIKQRTIALILLPIIYVSNNLLTSREAIDMVNSNFAKVSFYLIYCYIPILLILQWIVNKVRKKA